MFKKKKKEAEETESSEYSDEAMDQIMDEAEAGESEEGGSKTRSKNTKIALISVIGLVLISGIYFGSKYYDALLVQKDKLMVLVGLKKEEPKISEAEKKVSEEEKAKLAEMERIKKEERIAKRKKEAEEGGAKEENVAKEVQPEGAQTAKAPPPAAKAVEHIENQGKQKQQEAPKEHLAKKEEKEIPKNKESGKPAMPEPMKTTDNSTKAEKQAPAPASPAQAPHTSTSGGYAIQVGTFAVKENAVSLIQKLSEKGFESFGVPVYGSAGSNAVYAGPFYSRAEAEDAAREIKRAGVHGARVIYDKAEAIYKVDAGKYSSASKADDTEEKISSLGFEAISETEKNSGNLTAVYIGNFATEAQAEEVRKGLPKDLVPSSAVVKSPKQG
ncbi:MAG: SPOR domain-containing protein [Nitrospinae bacterium]|nr:SPOR domain-containing protein [Nitrospinota bacterium]